MPDALARFVRSLHWRPRSLRATGGLLALAILVLAGARTVSAWSHLRQAREIAVTDVSSALAACSELGAAYADAGLLLPVLRVGAVLPDARARAWAQVPALAQAANHGCQSLSTGASLLPSLGAADSTQGAGAALLAVLEAQTGDVDHAAAQASAALDDLAGVNSGELNGEPALAALGPRLERLRAAEPQLRSIVAMAPRLSSLTARLLGGDRPRTYLVMGQNNDEARATGGFMGTLGVLTVADGQVVADDVRSSYLWDNPQVPKPRAPAPLEYYMNFGGWYLRDANWWLDFRTSATQLLQMWDREQGTADAIDGVIALDQPALKLLLDAVDGVDVPDLGGHLTSSTVVPALDERRRSPDALRSYADYQERKSDAVSGIQAALLKRVAAARGSSLVRVGQALENAARNKHILIWFRDAELETVAAEQGWDGRVEQGTGDFLGVVDTSMSYGKVMPYIDKRVDSARGGDGARRVDVTYTNNFSVQPDAIWDPLIDGTWWDWRTTTFQRQQGAWLGYIRILAPPGSSLISADGWDDSPTTATEGTVTVFGAPVLVRPGQTRLVRLVYADPVPIDAPLLVYRQPGFEPLSLADIRPDDVPG
jgi:hypothetical protein